MRFLADENMPGPVVAALRAQNHDVLWIKESRPGASDAVVLELAQRDCRILVTADTDFGELAFHAGLPAQCGVILIRLDWARPDRDNRAVATVLSSREDWSGVFAVVEQDRVRIRSLPPSARTI
jgi:predicted nuclease of predicted toxin-antitoxin system